MSDRSTEGLCWGCFTHRPYHNLLSGSLPVPCGDRCAAEFLLFDSKEKVLFLCRYVDTGTVAECRACRLLMQPPAAALSNPRQLLLSTFLSPRVFASLEINRSSEMNAGLSTSGTASSSSSASVSVWQISSEISDVVECRLGDVLPADAVKTAKAICWVSRTLPRCARDGNVDLLTVLLADKVLLAGVKQADDASVSLEQLRALNIGFPCRCLCWSNDGSQLLVGGKGQLTCFAFEGEREQGPLVRHLLCSGECVEIQPAFSNVFLCRIDQCTDTSPAPTLLLPGQSLTGPSRPLVQVVENPQDAPHEGPSSLISGPTSAWQSPISADLASAVGLQVLPCQRYLLPIRCAMNVPWAKVW